MRKYYCLHCRALQDQPYQCNICGREELKEMAYRAQVDADDPMASLNADNGGAEEE